MAWKGAPVTVAAAALILAPAGCQDVEHGYATGCPAPLRFDSRNYAPVQDHVPVEVGALLGTGTSPSCVAYGPTPASGPKTEAVYAVTGFPSSQVIAVVDGGTTQVWAYEQLMPVDLCRIQIATCASSEASSS